MIGSISLGVQREANFAYIQNPGVNTEMYPSLALNNERKATESSIFSFRTTEGVSHVMVCSWDSHGDAQTSDNFCCLDYVKDKSSQEIKVS